MALEYTVNAKAPLLNWDFFSVQYNSLLNNGIKHQQSILKFKQIAKTNKWNKVQLKEALSRFEDHVIILTNPMQQISFTSNGFEQMTGYSFEEARGRNPNFLQGPKTDKQQVKLLKENISDNQTSEFIIQNYRKDGELYLCKIIIKPIISINQKLVNYIAYEQEVAA